MSRIAPIRRPRVARRQPALTDGLVHPVTVRKAEPSLTPLTDRGVGRPKLRVLTLDDVALLVDTSNDCVHCGDRHPLGFCPNCGACDFHGTCWNCGPRDAA